MSSGWIEVPEGEGQAAVVIHAATKTKHTDEAFYGGWGGWRWGGFADTTTFVGDYKVGTLLVDNFDAARKQAIWHGSASDALSDGAASNASATEKAVDKMFSN